MFRKSLVFSLFLFFPLPLILLVGVFHFHLFISILYLITSVLIFAEICCGIKTRQEYGAVILPTTAVIVAYLPNEKDIIVETLEHYLHNTEFSHVILAYNTPKPLEVEAVLRDMENKYSNLKLIRVPNSSSKAENLNYVLEGSYVNTDYLAIFDTDHRPCKEGLQYALTWLLEGYAAVQGRCLIHNRETPVGRIVAPEFDLIYRLLHTARFNITGSGIFGGSNGYWKKEIISQFRFRKVLTEDIDLSLRVLDCGYKIAHDPNVISLEEAPESLGALWKQRVRWAQGWLEVTLALTPKLMMSKHLGFFTKIYWFYNLVYRELFCLFSFSIFFVLLFYYILGVDEGHMLFPVSTGITSFAILVYALVSKFTCKVEGYEFEFTFNTLATYPYTNFKSLITFMAWTKNILRDTSWLTTSRKIKK